MGRLYKNIDHLVEAWGDSREELLSNLSIALVDMIADVDEVVPKREVEWSVIAASPEEMLANQLQEILHRFDDEGMVFSEFRISLRGLNIIKCLAYGEPFDPARHHFRTGVKAVSSRELSIGQEDDRWVGRFLFEV